MKKKGAGEIKIAGIEARPGRTARGWVTVGERHENKPLQIPLCIVNGAGPGPVLYLQAASDGNELNGVAVLHRVLKALNAEKLRGAVIAVPIVNMHALPAHSSSSPVDGKKMNRCFPGNKKGSSSERIAHFLFSNAVLLSDYCIDLHQMGVSPMIDECRVRVNKNERAGVKSLELARVFGIGHIFHQKGPDGQLARAAPAAGIPTIDPELGGTRGWDEKSIAKGVKGVLNVLKFYGMIAGSPDIPRRQVLVKTLKPVYSDSGGFLSFRKKLYDHVKKGEKVADILDPFGSKAGEALSPADGIFWARTPYPVAASGENIASIGAPVSHI